MDIKSFARRKNKENPEENAPSREELEKTVEELGKKSEAELLSELIGQVERGRSDGSFSNEALEEFMKNVAPMLSPEQRKRMETLAERLRM